MVGGGAYLFSLLIVCPPLDQYDLGILQSPLHRAPDGRVESRLHNSRHLLASFVPAVGTRIASRLSHPPGVAPGAAQKTSKQVVMLRISWRPADIRRDLLLDSLPLR